MTTMMLSADNDDDELEICTTSKMAISRQLILVRCLLHVQVIEMFSRPSLATLSKQQLNTSRPMYTYRPTYLSTLKYFRYNHDATE